MFTTAYLLFSLALATLYAAIMLFYWRAWRSLPTWVLPKDFAPSTAITVVIPARDEAANIGDCLRSIAAGDYPAHLLEILVVDDHSADETPQVVAQFAENQAIRTRLLRLAEHLAPGERLNSHKKKAIEIAVGEASGALIVTTDADCICPPDWLRLLASVFEKQGEAVQMVAAPVLFHREKNWLQRFQSLDFAGMMSITGAGIHRRFQRMGNGANLAYRASAFRAVGGFAGADARASGDDVFLMQKIAARWPAGIFFLKNRAATVLTEAKPTLGAFVRQRIRWGSKNAATPEKRVVAILVAVFFFCWNIVANVALLAIFPGKILSAALLIQLTIKALADGLLLREACRFFDRMDLLRWFGPSFFAHIAYIAGVGAASQFFQKYEWKGRRVR